MEFDADLLKLQGTLYSLGTRNMLNREDKIFFVITAIDEVIRNLSEESKSKIMFFMVLNSKLSFIERLKEDENLALFTGVIPLIDVPYLTEYAIKSDLITNLFKVIENCPAAFGEELIKPIKSLLFKEEKLISFCHYQFWQCLFVKICKINAASSKESCQEFVSQFQDVFFLIQKHTINEQVKSQIGFNLYNFFKTVLEMVRFQKNPDPTIDPIYKMSIQIDCKKTEKEEADCIGFVFKNMTEILQNLSVDTWMDLSECYSDIFSYQTLIGGVVHSLFEEAAEYDLPPGLSNFAINTVDVMTKTDVDLVISRVKNKRDEWFKGLVRHSAFTERKSIECMIEYLHLGNEDDLNVILHTSFEHITKGEAESSDLLKKLFLKTLKATDWSCWVEKIFEDYRPNLLTTSETHDEIVRSFNKIAKEKNISDSDLISLCLQSPCETLRKICELSVCSSQQIEMSVSLLKLLKRPCQASHSEGMTLLDHVLLGFLSEELPDKAKQTFVDLVVRLEKEKLLGRMFFIKLLGKLKNWLEEERFNSAVLSLKLEEGLLDLNSFEIDEPAFLVFMCQVLECLSWDFKSFSVVKADGREVAGRIVASVMKGLDDVSGVKFQWARQEILKMSEVNQSHFCDLWFSSGRVWSGSGKFHSCLLTLIHSRHRADDSKKYMLSFNEPFELIASIVLSLFLLLPVMTFREWNSIFEQLIIFWKNKDFEDVHYVVLDIFGTSIHVLISHFNEDEEIHPCREYCFRNFARLAQQHLEKMSGKSVLKIFEKIFVMIGTIENESKRKSCCEIFLSLMLESIDCMKKKNVVETNRKLINKLLPLLDSKDVAEAINKRLE